MPELDSTVVYIVLSCAGVPGCGILSWLLGKFGDTFSLRLSVLLVPLCLLFFVTLLLIERFVWRKEK